MTRLSLNADSLSCLLDSDEFLYLFCEKNGVNFEGNFSIILGLDDFEGTSFDRTVGETGLRLSQYLELFFKGLIRDYEFDHPVTRNLGSIVRKDGKTTFYGCGCYSDEFGQLYLSIGGTDRKAQIEPYKVYLQWEEKAKQWVIPNSNFVSLTEFADKIDFGDNKSITTMSLSGKFSIDDEVYFDQIWVSLAKVDKDPTKSVVSKAFTKAWNKKSESFADIVGQQGKGSLTVAKCNGIFSKYFQAGLLNSYSIPVVGLYLEKKQKKEKDGGTFSVLNIVPDFSGYPEIPVQVLEFSEQGTGSKTVPITEVSVIQFPKSTGSGENRRPSKYYRVLLDIEAGLIPAPTVENPFYLVFTNPPKKFNNTPDFSFWTNFVPPTVKILAEKCKSPGFINPSVISQLQEAVQVEASALSSGTRSEFVPTETFDLEDDDL